MLFLKHFLFGQKFHFGVKSRLKNWIFAKNFGVKLNLKIL